MYILTLIMSLAFASDCTDVQQKEEIKEERLINTDVPKHLQDATIIIRTKDGRESTVSANQFKVVSRKQQFIVTKVIEHTERTCKVSGKEKNLLMFGGRRDHKDIDTNVVGKTATVSSEKGLVVDATYMRQNVLDSKLGVGAGIDSNGTLRGVVGVEF